MSRSLALIILGLCILAASACKSREAEKNNALTKPVAAKSSGIHSIALVGLQFDKTIVNMPQGSGQTVGLEQLPIHPQTEAFYVSAVEEMLHTIQSYGIRVVDAKDLEDKSPLGNIQIAVNYILIPNLSGYSPDPYVAHPYVAKNYGGYWRMGPVAVDLGVDAVAALYLSFEIKPNNEKSTVLLGVNAQLGLWDREGDPISDIYKKHTVWSEQLFDPKIFDVEATEGWKLMEINNLNRAAFEVVVSKSIKELDLALKKRLQ